MFIRRFTDFLYLARCDLEAVVHGYRVRNSRGDIVARLFHGQELGERHTLFHRRGDDGYRVEFAMIHHYIQMLHFVRLH